MTGFIQLIEFETDDVEAIQDAIRKFRDEHPGVTTFTTSRVAEDRDQPGTYIAIVEFPSYEEAMTQSNHPDLSEFAQSMDLMVNRRFRNLDVKGTV